MIMMRQTLARPSAVTIATAMGVALPLTWFALVQLATPLSFDGAMNIQVAMNIAEGDGYRRMWASQELFPLSIQTSSYFIFIDAAAIALFGASHTTFVTANVVFAAVLLIAISLAMPRHVIARLLAPGAILAGVPGLVEFSGRGYGEGAIFGLAVLSIVAAAQALARDHEWRWLFASGLCVGAAISIKTVAVGILPVWCAIVLYVALRRRWAWPAVTGMLGAVLPIGAFEFYRLLTLRRQYFTWWKHQFSDIEGQAGARDEPASRIEKLRTHAEILQSETSVSTVLWGLLVIAVGAVVAAAVFRLWRTRKIGFDSAFERLTVLCAGLWMYGVLYLGWWLVITPTEKAWLRRITVGLGALELAGLLAAVLMLTWTVRSERKSRAAGLKRLAGVALILALAASLVPGLRTSVGKPLTPGEGFHNLYDLSNTIRELAANGATVYGVDWWSAPAVGAYAGVDLLDLRQIDACDSPLIEAVEDRVAFLVWDAWATGLVSTEPMRGGVAEADELVFANSAGSVWLVQLDPEMCPLP